MIKMSKLIHETKASMKYWAPKPSYENEKYTITISLRHCLIVTHDDKFGDEYYLFNLPISYNTAENCNQKILKILFMHDIISRQHVSHAFEKWRLEEMEIIFIKTDYRGLAREEFRMPVRRRGNEHYHMRTWSRIRWYEMVFNGFPHIYEKTERFRIVQAKSNKLKFYRKRVHLSNTLLITCTYPFWKGMPLGKAWSRTSDDTNRYLTNLKGRLERRGNKILFFFKALESTVNGVPHVHYLMKLKNAVEVKKHYNGWKKEYEYPAFDKTLFHWKYGHFDVRGIKTPQCLGYITKYITKATNPQNLGHQSLALSWVTNKRLYSTSMICLFKARFPAAHKFMQLTEKFTINKMVDQYWNGLKFPKIPWDNSYLNTRNKIKARFNLATRLQADRVSNVILKYPLESRLNYEGFYQVSALRCLKNQKSLLIPLGDTPGGLISRQQAGKKINKAHIRKLKQEFRIKS
jgi:hypothetical protein